MSQRTRTVPAGAARSWSGRKPGIVIVTLVSLLLALSPRSRSAQAVPAASPSLPAAASTPERDDYRTAAAVKGGAEMEKSARDFAARYPQSALRVYLFQKALRQCEQENDRAAILDVAHDILVVDPGDPQALVLIATAQADELSSADPDRAHKAVEIRQSAELALRNLDRGKLPAGAPPQQASLYRTTLQAMAYSALGIMKLKTGDDAGAEHDLKIAAELAKAHPDASVWYHLALAQEHRRKYSAAINSVEQAMQLASANPQLQRLAQTEHERLYRLSGRKQDSGGAQSGGSSPPE